MTLSTPVDAFTVERAAEAAYNASMRSAFSDQAVEPWATLNPYWKRLYRVQAQAVIEVIS